MADMTREEVDAKIVANEARSDAQVAAILGKIDALIARMDAFEQEMRETTRGIIDQMNSLKKTIIITGITSVLAIIFGVASFNATLLNNMNAMYDSGTASGAWRSKMEQETAETGLILQKINQRLDAIEAHQRNEAERADVKQARKSGRN
jgi:hypothetical protein